LQICATDRQDDEGQLASIAHETLTNFKKTLLQGKRVLLRPPQASDYHEYAAVMKKSAAPHSRWVNGFKGRAQFNEYLREIAADNSFRFLVCRREDDAIVGMISLFHIVRRSLQGAFVGYVIAAPHTRRGYGTEALQLVVDFAFKKLKLHRVEATIHPDNAASIALARRAGFTLEGRLRRYLKIRGRWLDHERWSILREDPRPKC
jgi:ribosomal-protein-alanine N-acetyltransferase